MSDCWLFSDGAASSLFLLYNLAFSTAVFTKDRLIVCFMFYISIFPAYCLLCHCGNSEKYFQD
jgi:hypothetical protein